MVFSRVALLHLTEDWLNLSVLLPTETKGRTKDLRGVITLLHVIWGIEDFLNFSLSDDEPLFLLLLLNRRITSHWRFLSHLMLSDLPVTGSYLSILQ